MKVLKSQVQLKNKGTILHSIRSQTLPSQGRPRPPRFRGNRLILQSLDPIFFRGPSGPTLLAASNITGQNITYSTLLLTSNVHP